MPTPRPFASIALLALAATAAAQSGWVQVATPNQPVVRAFHALAYDLLRAKAVMFGGVNFGFLADTWEWDGATWALQATLHSPPARASHALAYDIGRARIVLFGGSDALANADLDDTWEYDGIDWTQRLTANQPAPRRVARLVYDVSRVRCVLFGGGVFTGVTSYFGDTWEWDGSTWTLRNPTTSPPARWGHGMAYDMEHSRSVVFGGENTNTPAFSDTWTWDGTNWTQQLSTPSPPPVAWTHLAFDSARSRTVQFVQGPSGAETWLFDGTTWRCDLRAAIPPTRNFFAFAYDLVRGRTILFGGYDISHLSDTWEYDPGVVAQWTRFGLGCAGTAGVPTLQPVGTSLPILGTTFAVELLGATGSFAAISIGFSDQVWGTNVLPWSLGALGMTGCTLYSSPDFAFFVAATAGRASLSWPLPNSANLIGTRFFDQGFVLDPGRNPLGAVVSNAGAGTIGPF